MKEMSVEDEDFDTKSMSIGESAEAEDENSLETTEEDEEDEREPKLKFERISNDLKGILLKDSISCCAVHPKVSHHGNGNEGTIMKSE